MQKNFSCSRNSALNGSRCPNKTSRALFLCMNSKATRFTCAKTNEQQKFCQKACRPLNSTILEKQRNKTLSTPFAKKQRKRINNNAFFLKKLNMVKVFIVLLKKLKSLKKKLQPEEFNQNFTPKRKTKLNQKKLKVYWASTGFKKCSNSETEMLQKKKFLQDFYHLKKKV